MDTLIYWQGGHISKRMTLLLLQKYRSNLYRLLGTEEVRVGDGQQYQCNSADGIFVNHVL